jgi:hypothetical protein
MANEFFGAGKVADRSCDGLRVALKTIAAQVMDVKDAIAKESNNATKDQNVGEMLANITLAYRAIEDAAMRIGKVKQHNNGGVSPYDANVVGSPAGTTSESKDATVEEPTGTGDVQGKSEAE